jgi:hypothetical protein
MVAYIAITAIAKGGGSLSDFFRIACRQRSASSTVKGEISRA